MKTRYIYVFSYEFITCEGNKASTRMYFANKEKAVETLEWIARVQIDLYKQNGTYQSDFLSQHLSTYRPSARCVVLNDGTGLWFEVERSTLF